jgi:malonate transporter and related proteins
MLAILSITGPIYLLMALGFAATQWGAFEKSDMRTLGKFVIQLALPALLFKALSQNKFSEFFNWGYCLTYAAGTLATVAIGYLWSHQGQRQDATTSTFSAMGMACSNSGFVGYPIMLLVLAPIAPVALAMNMMVENLLVIPLLLFLADTAAQGHASWGTLTQSLKNLGKNPMILAILAGLIATSLNLALPEVLTRSINFLALSCSALSLFVIGGTLAGLSLKGMGSRVWPVVIGKLVLHPLMVLGAIALLQFSGGAPGFDAHLQTAVVLTAAMPMMGIYTTLALKYHQEALSAAALLLATVASFFTLNLILWACHDTLSAVL